VQSRLKREGALPLKCCGFCRRRRRRRREPLPPPPRI
jgi:hypothetical protein